jgi:hypothetical protein
MTDDDIPITRYGHHATYGCHLISSLVDLELSRTHTLSIRPQQKGEPAINLDTTPGKSGQEKAEPLQAQQMKTGKLARPAGIEPATPAFGVLPARHNPL